MTSSSKRVHGMRPSADSATRESTYAACSMREVAGAPGDEAGVGRLDLERLDAAPQLGQPDDQVEGVGHQRVRRPRGDRPAARPARRSRTPRRRGPHATEPPGPLAAGQPGQLGVEAVGVVDDRVLHRDPQHLDLALALGARHLLGVIEERGLGQLVEVGGQVHDPTQAPTTDNALDLVTRPVERAER